MKRSLLFLGALAFTAPTPALAKTKVKGPEDAPAQAAAAPEAPADAAPADAAPAEPMPPGFDKLSPEMQLRVASLDDATLQALGAKLDRGETLTADEQALAEALQSLYTAEFDAKLHYQTGDVTLGSDLAVLHLGDAYRFLGPEDAKLVIEQAWHNPPGATPLGMLTPRDLSPADPRGWGVVLSYTEDGHVDDADAESIDYDELLTEMKASTEAENESRKAAGFAPIHLVGWAEAPHYDKARHSLYWAKELAGDDTPEHSLNYAIRVLGRKGVLELNAVASMTQLPQIKPEMEQVYALVEFKDGNRYTDFDPDIDQMAVYGIGGLIAGKMAAKAGLFAIILKGLLAMKKGLILLGIGLVAGIKALFSRKKE